MTDSVTDAQRQTFDVVPQGWSVAQLGDVGEVNLGKTPRKNQYTSEGTHKIIKFRDVEAANKLDWETSNEGFVTDNEDVIRSLRKLHKNDILVTASAHASEHIGKKLVHVSSIPAQFKDVYYVGELLCIRCFEQECLPRLIYYFLSSDYGYKAIQNHVRGVHLIASEARRILVPLPPLDEQRRIVAAIEEQFSRLDAGVSALERVRANLKRYRTAVLKAAVEGKLTEAWREENPNVEPASKLLERILKERRDRWEKDQLAEYEKKGKKPPKNWRSKYKEPAGSDTDNLPELPEGWCWANLPQIGWFDRGRSRHRPRNAPHLYGGPYPFIQTGDVRHAETFIRDYKQTYSKTGLQQSKLWPAGTLCITIAANIAETAILSFDACFPDSVVGFLASVDHVSTRFVEIYLRTIRERLEAYAPATAQKNINIETLKQIAIALPPLAEQKQIVAEVDRRLSILQEVENEAEDNLKRASRLRKAILKRAFEGKLVPQDPTDEPATELLERIRAEREQNASGQRRKKRPARNKPAEAQAGLF